MIYENGANSVQLSILIPVCNAATHLVQCLNSIKNSLELGEFSDSNSVEIIILNDGSTDGSDALLSRAASELESLRLLPQHETTLGVSETRNDLLAASRGRYIWFVDADDLVEPDALKRFRQIIAASEPEIIFTDFQVFSGKEPSQGASRKHSVAIKKTGNFEGTTAALNALFTSGQFQLWSKIHKRSLYLEDRLFPANRIFEDVVASTILTLRAKRFHYDATVWLSYRRHDQSLVSTPNLSRELDRVFAVFETARVLYADKGTDCSGSRFYLFAAKHLEKSYRMLAGWRNDEQAGSAIYDVLALERSGPSGFLGKLERSLLAHGHLIRLTRLVCARHAMMQKWR